MMSPAHWIIVVLIVLLVFGAGRLGEVGKGLGDGIRNFKKGMSGGDDDADADVKQLKGDKDKPVEGEAAKPQEVQEKKEKA
jgi:sec-independent protein translocase protein TatA